MAKSQAIFSSRICTAAAVKLLGGPGSSVGTGARGLDCVQPQELLRLLPTPPGEFHFFFTKASALQGLPQGSLSPHPEFPKMVQGGCALGSRRDVRLPKRPPGGECRAAAPHTVLPLGSLVFPTGRWAGALASEGLLDSARSAPQPLLTVGVQGRRSTPQPFAKTLDPCGPGGRSRPGPGRAG